MPDLTPIQRDLQQLDVDMRRLEAEYTLFFNHRRARPPWELRKKVESLIRRWDNSHIASTADRFRFNTLQARFATFSDLWERHMRDRDSGRSSGPPRAPDRSAPGAGARILHVTRMSDPAREPVALDTLYHNLNKARQEHGEGPIGFDQFAELVREQVAALRTTGSSTAAFRIAVEDGHVTLTVRGLNEEA